MFVVIRAHTRKRRDRIAERKTGYHFRRFGNNRSQTLGSGIRIVSVNFLGCRSHENITVDRRRYKHSFSEFCRSEKQRAFRNISRGFIQQNILPSSCVNGIIVADKLRDFAAANPCAVYNDFRFNLS